jgi:hypothetical protein
MARQDRFKYNYIHGAQDQLYDLALDPGEGHNLIGCPAYGEVAQVLQNAILERFDPERMARENLESLYRRRYIRDVMAAQGTGWDYQPHFDPRKGALDQYLTKRELYGEEHP